MCLMDKKIGFWICPFSEECMPGNDVCVHDEWARREQLVWGEQQRGNTFSSCVMIHEWDQAHHWLPSPSHRNTQRRLSCIENSTFVCDVVRWGPKLRPGNSVLQNRPSLRNTPHDWLKHGDLQWPWDTQLFSLPNKHFHWFVLICHLQLLSHQV